MTCVRNLVCSVVAGLAALPSVAAAQVKVEKSPSAVTVYRITGGGEDRSLIAARGHMMTDVDKVSRDRVFVFGDEGRTPTIRLTPATVANGVDADNLFYSAITLESGYVYCQLYDPDKKGAETAGAIKCIAATLDGLADKGRTAWIDSQDALRKDGKDGGVSPAEHAPAQVTPAQVRPDARQPEVESEAAILARARFYFPFVLIRSLAAGSEGTEVVFWATSGSVYVYFQCGETDAGGTAKSPVQLYNRGSTRELEKPGQYARYNVGISGLLTPSGDTVDMPPANLRTEEQKRLMQVVDRARADFLAVREHMDKPIPPEPCKHAQHR